MTTILPSLILLAGVADDIATRKFHNWMFGICFGVAAIFCVTSGGIGSGLLSMLTAFFLFLPMVMLKITGAGDLKLMLAFGLASSMQAVINVAIFSVIWAVVFGLVKAGLDKKLSQIFKNIVSMIKAQKVESSELHRIPYTIALFFGWMSHLAVNNGRWL